MSLERKDIRAKLDPDMHEALVAVCEDAGIDIGEFVEQEIVRIVSDAVQRAHSLHAKTSHLGIAGKIRAKTGKGH